MNNKKDASVRRRENEMSDVIAPASVPQELFLNSDDTDIVFYGGKITLPHYLVIGS